MNIRLKPRIACGAASAASILMLAATAQAAGAAPVESVLYNFDVTLGANSPQAALTPGPDGVYYGTADRGGAAGNGIVFEFIPPAAGQSTWTENPIYAFSGSPDGATPSSGLLLGTDGALYGVAAQGGAHGAGTIFKLAPPTAGQPAWTETTLYSFTGGADGNAPYGTLIADGNGVLYGSTAGGGNATSSGVVFSLTPPAAGQTSWAETTLYEFQGKDDRRQPQQRPAAR